VNAIDWAPSPYVDRQNIVNKQLILVTLLQNRPNKGIAAKIVQINGLFPKSLERLWISVSFLAPNTSISV
jgi:hypothetical protein